MIILGRLYSSTPSRRLRGVICREIEMRLAGRAETRSWFTHTVKSHRQLAAGAAHHPASDTDLSQELLQIQNLMAAITHSPAPSPNSSLLLTMLDAVQQLPVNDFWPRIAQEDIGPNLRKTGRIGDKENREVQKDLLVRWPLFVVAWINIHDWKHKDSLQSRLPGEYGCLSFSARKTIICLNEPVLCVCVCMCEFEWRMQPSPCRVLQNSGFSHKIMKTIL